MRTFISIAVDNPLVLEKINHFLIPISNLKSQIKFVDSTKFHFTLRFLGDISDDSVYDISNLLTSVKFNNFSVSFDSVGVFPNKNSISVIWIGVDSNSSSILQSLSDCVNSVLPDLPNLKTNKFVPHVTLCRIKHKLPDTKLIDYLDHNFNFLFGTQLISSFSLMKSELTSAGPIYTTLYKYKLVDE